MGEGIQDRAGIRRSAAAGRPTKRKYGIAPPSRPEGLQQGADGCRPAIRCPIAVCMCMKTQPVVPVRPGTYTVTITVEDDDGATGSDTLVVTVLGARDLKARAIEVLTPFADDGRKAKRFKKAIRGIEESLAPELWVDQVHLDENHGHRVFSEERHAVKELEAIINDEDVSPEARIAAQAAIDLLVKSDRVLAITQMLDAAGASGPKPRDQKKIDKENATSTEEFAAGDASRDISDYDRAIQEYRKSWEHATHALRVV